jgi:hypothetical protein
MAEVEHLDSHGSLERLVKRDYKSDKFIVGVVLGEGIFSTYISSAVGEVELVYMIQMLQDRRDKLFND